MTMMPVMVFPLKNVVQPYAWGSKTAIPDLFGLANPSGDPMAEIWMGAHAKAPSRLTVDAAEITLDQYVASDPIGTLGSRVADRFGPTLPFLFKILAAAQPLSIQAHPSKVQAEAGFAREESAGVDRAAGERNYRDDNHKPELIYALTDFWGLRGFRPPTEISDALGAVAGGDTTVVPLPADDAGLPAFFRALMTLPESARAGLIDSALRIAGVRWPDMDRFPAVGDPDAGYYWVQALTRQYPGDIGTLAPLFLNVFSLRPGEATFQPAGVLHAYLHGTGAEVMANSDNVLRGGLTVKHVDLDELLAVGVFRAEESQVITGEAGYSADGCQTADFPAPFEEFAFSRIEVGGNCALPTGIPQILFCSAGHLDIRAGADPCEIGPGESLFVRADEPSLHAAGVGTLLRAAVGGGKLR